jgi:copper chaperone CopZ
MRTPYALLLILGLAISGCGIGHSEEPPMEELTMSVPTMSCPNGCFPIVKETLEKQEGVQSVELYPQASPDEITDRRVRVSFKGAFDADKAISALATEGFEGATVEAQR